MRVLIDMNLSSRWVSLLTSNGHEAVHWSMLGPANSSDDALIDHASDHGHIILTNDLDFGITLITNGRTRPSVIQLRSEDLRPSTLGSAVLAVLDAHADALNRGALVTIDAVRERIRLLSLVED